MAGMVKLDLGAIADTATDADRIRRTFDDSDDSSRAAADACGHADLADTVRRFATTWDDRRRGMSDALGTLAGVLRDIHTAFEDLDRTLGESAGAR
ncbi:hypothetical protein [Microbacterium hibisci]|uniref:hypothetical protein n=1 Tax=Microbacterium hibisci TaxID=2036000 RepID=UPI001940A951|nr:hypothetical protein [Microbacterium hibisci]